MKLKTIITVFLLSISLSIFSQDKPQLDVGGALRFNYNLSSWKDGQKKRGGDFGYDVFRINAKAKYKGVKLNAEYRLYSTGFGGGMLKQGWVAYDFSEKNEIQIGLTQVPFGITQYNSHNWFFNLGYYVGLEDDHDMGIKYLHTCTNWEFRFAFFKNAEELRFGNNSDISDSRYSYDVSSIDLDGDGDLDIRNKEINQFNGKLVYKFGGKKVKNRIGVSVQYGGLYNLDTEKNGSHYAIAGHYELNAGNLNVKTQVANYKYDPKNPQGEPDNVVAMGAYGFPYLTAAEGTMYTFAMAYSIPVNWGPISNLQFYNDFGMLDKAESSFENSFMNVTGVLISAGQVYTYVDYAAGKDHPWLGPNWTNGLAAGDPDAEWEARFNINIGYYF